MAANVAQFAIRNGMAPEDDTPLGTAYTLDFTNSAQLNFANGVEGSPMEAQDVQCLWVDNATSGKTLTLTIQGMGQKIVIPPNAQGIYPVIYPILTFGMTAVLSSAGGIVPIILLNVPMPLYQHRTV